MAKTIERLREALNGQGRILQVEPGFGQESQALVNAGFVVDGLYRQKSAQLNSWIKEKYVGAEESVAMSFQHYDAIWLHESISQMDPKRLLKRLGLYHSWLKKNGWLMFCCHEGEGSKAIVERGVYGDTKRTIRYYQPEHIERLLAETSFTARFAWRERRSMSTFLHIMAQQLI